MYMVWIVDEWVCDDVVVFEGSLEECREVVAEGRAIGEDPYITARDGSFVE